MSIEEIRAKQKAAQAGAIEQRRSAESIVRIGNHLPVTGKYEVLEANGGVDQGGVKVYNAQHQYGDRVLAYPRLDGTIALDSEKGSIVRPPTAFPHCSGYLSGQVFNCEEPKKKKKKGGVWIFYRSAGKLWIGGHQAEPEELGTLSVIADYNNDPLSPVVSGYHVWGDDNGWVATFQVTERTPLIVNGYRSSAEQAINFHCITSDGGITTRDIVRRMVGQSSTENIRNPNGQESGESMSSHSVFPLGAGIVAFRSNVVPSVIPVGSGSRVILGDAYFTSLTYSGSIAASVGYLELGAAITESFEISHKNIYTRINDTDADTHSSEYFFDGTTRIPNVGVREYKGAYTLSEAGVYSTRSMLTYAIMCDRRATYYIRETVLASGANPQRRYELFSSGSAQVIATNLSEPRFFGIRWDIRDFRVDTYQIPLSNYASISALYNNPIYYFSYASRFPLGLTFSQSGLPRPETIYLGPGALPVGYHKRSRVQQPNSPPLIPAYDYDNGTPVTFSGGAVVQIPATEISKATIGDGDLVRRAIEVSGAFSTLEPIYCHAIPADAVILHWSTTA